MPGAIVQSPMNVEYVAAIAGASEPSVPSLASVESVPSLASVSSLASVPSLESVPSLASVASKVVKNGCGTVRFQNLNHAATFLRQRGQHLFKVFATDMP